VCRRAAGAAASLLLGLSLPSLQTKSSCTAGVAPPVAAAGGRRALVLAPILLVPLLPRRRGRRRRQGALHNCTRISGAAAEPSSAGERLFAFEISGLHCGHPKRSIWVQMKRRRPDLFTLNPSTTS